MLAEGGSMDRKRARPVAVATGGMLATSQPLAAEIGVEVLRAGGNAVDAALAANIALGLVEPMSCGLGGDLFALVGSAAEGRLVGLNGSGRAPKGLTLELFRKRDLDRVPTRGPLTWTVPGCVDAWATLHARLGRLPWHELFQPTIEAARTGFQVTPVIAAAWAEATDLLTQDAGSAGTFLVDGHAPRAGETFRNADLADTLSTLARDGADAFYRGDVGAHVAACARSLGSPLSRDDLGSHTSTWVEPIAFSFRGVEVWELPPNTQGVVVLEMLNILSRFDLAALHDDPAAYLHILVEAKKLAYENRARLYADPEFSRTPIERLLTPEHGESQAARIDADRAAVFLAGDGALPGSSDTVYITAVDEDRNAVSLIQSIYHGFGSGITPPGLGFAMQNRGALFALDSRHPNALASGKRPFHTIIPAMVTQRGQPVFSFGVMGGDMQPQGHVQVLLHVLVHGRDPQRAGEAPRFRHDGSSTPTGDVMRDGGIVHLEPEFPDEAAAGLRQRGHRVEITTGGYGGYQGIWIDRDRGFLLGGSEPRKDGLALGT
jgi:gamma-glutamyltranspeptidase/glutathione hydrolase